MQHMGDCVKVMKKNLLTSSFNVGQRSPGNSSIFGKPDLSVASLFAETSDIFSHFSVDSLSLHNNFITAVFIYVNLIVC